MTAKRRSRRQAQAQEPEDRHRQRKFSRMAKAPAQSSRTAGQFREVIRKEGERKPLTNLCPRPKGRQRRGAGGSDGRAAAAGRGGHSLQSLSSFCPKECLFFRTVQDIEGGGEGEVFICSSGYGGMGMGVTIQKRN